ncbi:MAG TPA: tetratricopeptide repeat protein, partial [Rhodanobacteraceae bacterium]|nr:tetratricopeptide repeat protein [Rhodanobacteraceae bacterium]
MRPPGLPVWRIAITLTALAAISSFAATPDRRAPLLKSIDALLEGAHYDSARTITIDAMHEAEARGDSAATGPLSFRLGRVSVTLGNQAIARRELDRAIRLTTASRDTANLAQALLFRGFVHRDMKEFDDAMANFHRALDISHRAHIASAEGDATYNIAYRELRQGNLEAARPGYLRAMELWRSTGDQFLIASGGNALGNLYTVLGDVDSARYWYNQALRISRANGYPFYELWARNNLGDIERRVGNYEAGLAQYRTALAIGKRIKFDRGIALTSMNMALMLSYLGQHDLAFKYLDEALTVCKRAGFKDLEVTYTIFAGALNLGADRSARAATLFRRILSMDFVYDANRRNEAAYGLSVALAQMDSIDQAIAVLEPNVSPRAKIVHNMSQAYFEMGYVSLLRRAGRCSEALTRIRALDADLAGNKDLGVDARLLESSCRRLQGDRAGAARSLTIALDSLEVARSHFEQADVREAYGLHMMNDVIEGCRVLMEYPVEVPSRVRVRNFYDALQRFKTRTLLERIRDPGGTGATTLAGSVAHPVTSDRLQKNALL